MASERFIRGCRNWYAKLLRLYPKPYRERFGEEMEQTFNDLCRERMNGGLFRVVVWMYLETSAEILRENTRLIIMQKSIVRVALVTACILLIPLIGNLFFAGWHWNLFDFVVCGGLVFGTGLAYELVKKKVGTIWYRLAVGVALTAAFLLVWVNGAVQIIGDNNPANLMFFVVPLVGLIGAAVARLRPHGMARALFATALAQALVPVIALMVWTPETNSWSPGVLKVFVLNAFFVLLFVASAFLFRRAGIQRA